MSFFIPIIVIILLFWFLSGYIAFRVFLQRGAGKKLVKKALLLDSPPESFNMEHEWFENAASKEVTIRSHDGLALHAFLISGESNGRYVISCHGYKARAAANSGFARLYLELGYSVLLPDARAHGKSEGKYIGMGYPERLDILQWIDYILSIDPNARIVLNGVSMGGATVMNTVGEDLPDNVVCAIEDCGFISPREIFEYQLKIRRLPHYLLFAAAPFAAFLAHFSALDTGRTAASLRRCKIPMLMIHGEKDNFVPVSHLYKASKACGKNAETVIIPHAGHAECISKDKETYRAVITSFLNRSV